MMMMMTESRSNVPPPTPGQAPTSNAASGQTPLPRCRLLPIEEIAYCIVSFNKFSQSCLPSQALVQKSVKLTDLHSLTFRVSMSELTVGHGSDGSTNPGWSRRSRVSTRDPLTREVDPKSFKGRFLRDNWVADRRRVSGLSLFFQ